MKYKAILYSRKLLRDVIDLSGMDQDVLDRCYEGGTASISVPVDVFYLNKKSYKESDKESYKAAEKYFFRDKKWKRDDSLHIEILPDY